ncbi:AIPR family protein [Burkholderia cenocepacia]|uniref:AIPR family protein n=1 Tax=Burkholderia cenocepacia TaxID=95486 RepID=UPI000F5AA291|nr:AIPR family protein [Burkholderia cenocepacia]RQU51577.1 abortive phage infection protein [Burkholderia cenocepacia]RQV34176.1 abortive phage infection protein [Burkholderia cenocepacia]
MELSDFLAQTQAQVNTEVNERLVDTDGVHPRPELIFAEIVMRHMSEVGMTFEPEVCHHSSVLDKASLSLSGFSISEDLEQLDLFVSIYDGKEGISSISDAITKNAAEECLQFLTKCVQGTLAAATDDSSEAYPLILTIQENYPRLEQIRIYVLTDRRAKTRNFRAREVNGKTVKLEVMDIERLHRHWSEGKPRDELVINFEEVSGSALPCVYVPGQATDYDYALTVIPGEALRFIYEKYGARLLEANVRSFLSVAGKVNRGVRDTLRDNPERFMAYNNGIVLVADEAHLGKTVDGGPGLLWLKGMQIVNGGQTTASIYFAKRKNPSIDLRNVRVPAKVIVLRSTDTTSEEALISDISRYANSQNAVKLSDLSANKPFHVELERLASTTYCPDGVGKWFYERAAGSYNTWLAREGATAARLRHLKEAVTPPSRKITKTDLAKFLYAWDCKPHFVSMGAQKNFERFMESLSDGETNKQMSLPDVVGFKQIVAKAILFKRTSSIVRPLFPAFQGNVTAYLISILSLRTGGTIDFERIWLNQSISHALTQQLKTWAFEVNEVLHKSASGRMVSEWAKKTECWETVKSSAFSPTAEGIPEVSLNKRANS